jgi:hypothetical protein
LEWSLPDTWRAKFDLDSYIPTLHSRAKLIEACEANERSEIAVERPSREESSQSHRNIKRSASKNSTEPQKQKKQKSDGKHYCSEHGYNPTHSTADCYTIKNRAKARNHAPWAYKRSFSNQNLRKEINLLARTSSKKKILEMYASVIKKEQAKLDGSKKPEKWRKIVAPKSESDDKMSVQVICAPQKNLRRKPPSTPWMWVLTRWIIRRSSSGWRNMENWLEKRGTIQEKTALAMILLDIHRWG